MFEYVGDMLRKGLEGKGRNENLRFPKELNSDYILANNAVRKQYRQPSKKENNGSKDPIFLIDFHNSSLKAKHLGP